MADDRTASYLDEVAARLELPEPYASDVRHELADHLADATDALIAQGRAPEDAERESLARLGPPAVLADELRRAHQTRRRLLAGAAGGVWSAVGHGIGGTILGLGAVWMTLYLILIAGSVVTHVLNVNLDLRLDDTIPSESWNTTLIAAGLAIGAFLGGRRAVQATAAKSLRPVRALGRWWALGGAAVLSVWVLFVLQMALSWPAVIAELLIPLAFAAGATIKTDRPGPRIRSRHILLVFVGGFVLPTLLAFGLGAQTTGGGHETAYGSADDMWRAMRFDVVGRRPPDEVQQAFGGGGWAGSAGVVTPTVSVASTVALAGWHDFRFEAWRRDPQDASIAPNTKAPLCHGPGGAPRKDAERHAPGRSNPRCHLLWHRPHRRGPGRRAVPVERAQRRSDRIRRHDLGLDEGAIEGLDRRRHGPLVAQRG